MQVYYAYYENWMASSCWADHPRSGRPHRAVMRMDGAFFRLAVKGQARGPALNAREEMGIGSDMALGFSRPDLVHPLASGAGGCQASRREGLS